MTFKKFKGFVVCLMSFAEKSREHSFKNDPENLVHYYKVLKFLKYYIFALGDLIFQKIFTFHTGALSSVP